MILLGDEYIHVAEGHMQDEYPNFKETEHIIIGTSDHKGSIGVELYDRFVWITWCYANSFTSKREINYALEWLYRFYTVQRSRTVLYTGKQNVMRNNSVQVGPRVWQFIPKRYML